MPGNGGQVAPLEDEPQAVLPALLVLQAEQPLGERLLGRDVLARARPPVGELRLLRGQCRVRIAQFEKRAVCLAHRLFRGLQDIGRLAPRLLGPREFLLQPFDALAQLPEVFLGGRGRRGLRARARSRRRQAGHEPDAGE